MFTLLTHLKTSGREFQNFRSNNLKSTASFSSKPGSRNYQQTLIREPLNPIVLTGLQQVFNM